MGISNGRDPDQFLKARDLQSRRVETFTNPDTDIENIKFINLS